jgi:DNA-directed RNA polymerase specialized sigma24 family protein
LTARLRVALDELTAPDAGDSASASASELQSGGSQPPRAAFGSGAASFEDLYEQHFEFTWRVLRHLGLGGACLNDGCQELWLVVHRRLPTIAFHAQVRTWLFGVAVNVARNQRRSAARRRCDPALPVSLAAPQPWAIAVRPLVPWLGGAFIGACTTLAIAFGWDRVPGDARVAERVDVAASEELAASLHGTAGPLGIAGARPTPSTPVQSARAAPDRSVPSVAPPRLELAEALELLHRAERALHAGDAEFARGTLSELDRRAEPALLREERLTTLVLALCQGGRVHEALAVRRQLEREFASSIYLGRLDESCAVGREHR